MDELIKKIKFIKNKNIVLDLFNYIISENLKYKYNKRGMSIYYDELSEININSINDIINNNYYDYDKTNIIIPKVKIQFNYDINYFINNHKINKIITNCKLNPINDKRDYSITYLNLLKITNNK